MTTAVRLVLTVFFGLVWMWVYTSVGAASAIVILGSVLTLCVCCCRGSGDPPAEWDWQRYFRCLQRCRAALLVLIVALFLIGALWPVVNGNPVPPGAVLAQILIAAIGSVLTIRLICCLYDG